MLLTSAIRDALRDCYDPALPCNIVDLGLIRGLDVQPDPDAPGTGIPGVPQKVNVRLTITSTDPTDDARAQLSAQIRNRLAGLEAVSRADITFEQEPAWSPRDLTPAGRRTLGLDGNRSLVQIR